MMTTPDYVFWDFAGVDGLQAAIALFSPAVNRIAPFQSLTTSFDDQPCSVLRLCENNFRVALPADETAKTRGLRRAITDLNLEVWSKPCSAASFVVSPELGLARLGEISIAKPPHQLEGFMCDRAVPARIEGIAILAWHHLWCDRPTLTIQTAHSNIKKIRQAFL